MSATSDTSSTKPTLTGPGLIFATSRITDPALSPEAFNKWYSDIHLPDVIATGSVTGAWRFQDPNPTAKDPYLALYAVPDLTLLQDSEAMKRIPLTSDLLPGGGPASDFVEFETRIYQLIQDYEGNNPQDPESYFPNLISVNMELQPETGDELDRWYRQEHLAQMAREPGWRRSRRYRLVTQSILNSKGVSSTQEEDLPTWLVIYEFDEKANLGIEVKALDPVTDWTRRVVEQKKIIDSHVWTKLV